MQIMQKDNKCKKSDCANHCSHQPQDSISINTARPLASQLLL